MRAKRRLAVLLSVLFCPVTFLLLWLAVLYGPAESRTVLFGYPLLTAAYFLIAGAVFQKKLGLRLVTLWLWMALPGHALCWALLLLWQPQLLQNGMALVLFLALMAVQVPMWLAVWLGLWIAGLIRGRRPGTGPKNSAGAS